MFTAQAMERLKEMNALPPFDRKHEKLEITDIVFHEVQSAARRLNDELDPNRFYATTKNTVFLEQGGDMPVFEHNVTLWPLDILEEEKQRFRCFYLDPNGRLFGQHIVAENTPNATYFHIPQELKRHTIDPFDAIAVQQALQVYMYALEHEGNQPGHNID